MAAGAGAGCVVVAAGFSGAAGAVVAGTALAGVAISSAASAVAAYPIAPKTKMHPAKIFMPSPDQ